MPIRPIQNIHINQGPSREQDRAIQVRLIPRVNVCEYPALRESARNIPTHIGDNSPRVFKLGQSTPGGLYRLLTLFASADRITSWIGLGRHELRALAHNLYYK